MFNKDVVLISSLGFVLLLFSLIITPRLWAQSYFNTDKVWEDGRISIKIDKIERSGSYPKVFRMPGRKYKPPKKGNEYLTIHFTVIRVENVFLGMPNPSDPNNPILIDSEGNEYTLTNMQYKGVKYIDGFTGNKYYIAEGAKGIFMFVFPKKGRLKTLKFYYTHWKSWESRVIKYGLIDISL